MMRWIVSLMQLFRENLPLRWSEWRARRAAIQEGRVIDIRTVLKQKGLP